MSDEQLEVSFDSSDIQRMDLLTANRSAWVRATVRERLNRELDGRRTREYNELDLQGHEIVDPHNADFSDTEVVKTVNRPAVLACMLRYKTEKQGFEFFIHNNLMKFVEVTFGVTDETAKKYLKKIVEARVLVPHLSIDPVFSGKAALKTARRDLESHFENKLEYDRIMFRDYPAYYRYRNSLPQMTGTPDESPWLNPEPVYYPSEAIAKEPCQRYLQQAVRAAPPIGEHGERFSSKYVFGRLVAVAMKRGYVTSAEARDLISQSPYSSFSSIPDGPESILAQVKSLESEESPKSEAT